MRYLTVIALTIALYYLTPKPSDTHLYYAAASAWSFLYCIIVLFGIRIRESKCLCAIEIFAMLFMLITVLEITLAPNSIWYRNHYGGIMSISFIFELIILTVGGVRYGFTHISNLRLNLYNFLSSFYRDYRTTEGCTCTTTRQAA